MKEEEKIDTIIGKSSSFNGNVKVTGGIRIDGVYEGNIESHGTITLGKDGKIKGELKTKNAVVGGEIVGNMIASDRVEFQTGAIFQGDLICKTLIVEEGVVFDGSCKMSEKYSTEKKLPEE